MPQFNLYLSQEELEWLSNQPRGWLRAIVRRYREKYPQRVPEE